MSAPKFKTLKALAAAYKSGELTDENPLILDNDTASVYVGDDEVYQAHPNDILDCALELLGIPTESV